MAHNSILPGQWARRIIGTVACIVLLLGLTISGGVMSGCSSDDGGCPYTFPINNQPVCAEIGLALDCQEAFQDLNACLLENCICDVAMDCSLTFETDDAEECTGLKEQFLCATDVFVDGTCRLANCQKICPPPTPTPAPPEPSPTPGTTSTPTP